VSIKTNQTLHNERNKLADMVRDNVARGQYDYGRHPEPDREYNRQGNVKLALLRIVLNSEKHGVDKPQPPNCYSNANQGQSARRIIEIIDDTLVEQELGAQKCDNDRHQVQAEHNNQLDQSDLAQLAACNCIALGHQDEHEQKDSVAYFSEKTPKRLHAECGPAGHRELTVLGQVEKERNKSDENCDHEELESDVK